MSSKTAPAAARKSWWVLGLALLLPLTLIVAGVIWWRGGLGSLIGREQCIASTPTGSVSLEPEQAEHAATIAAEALRRGLPARAVTVALAAAMQESKLRNLSGGDHDSAGLFQQRPSQGWGSFEQVTDPVYATGRFYDALANVDGWQTLAITEAAQAVQHSAFPGAYQEHADDARIMSAIFSGRVGAGLTCTVRAESETRQQEGPTGLTARAQLLREAMEGAFGTLSLGGFAPGGVTRPNPSAHNAGRAIDVFFRPFDDPTQRHRGWSLAHWLVAHADRLDIAILIYRDRIWSAERSPEGWRDYISPFGDPNDPVQRHLDHIHVEVVEGE